MPIIPILLSLLANMSTMEHKKQDDGTNQWNASNQCQLGSVLNSFIALT